MSEAEYSYPQILSIRLLETPLPPVEILAPGGETETLLTIVDSFVDTCPENSPSVFLRRILPQEVWHDQLVQLFNAGYLKVVINEHSKIDA